MNPDQTTAISEIKDILVNYDLGELIDLERDERGFVNTSYSIKTKKQGKNQKFFLRRYKPGKQQVEIDFEHATINHLLDRDFALVAKVFHTKGGETYCKKSGIECQNQPIYYAIFDYLPGEDKYTWVDPGCSSLELLNSAIVLAQFHHAVADFRPAGRRFEQKILKLLPQITENVFNSLQNSKSTAFDSYLRDHADRILDSCKSAQDNLSASRLSDCPQIVIHCDYHPGNLKFEGEQIVGLFDFDWSKIDLRCFDVALAIWYFLTSWKDENDGALRLDECHLFLKSYQSTLSDLPDLTPLNKTELQYLPMMINLGNLYIMNWTIIDFYTKDVDPEEYLSYLRHCVNFTRWFTGIGHIILQDQIREWIS